MKAALGHRGALNGPAWQPAGRVPSRRQARILGPAFLAVALVLSTACGPARPAVSDASLIVTQTPIEAGVHENPGDALDLLYPAGSRVVLVPQPDRPDRVIVLSQGLRAAGGPVLGPDGRDVLFAGKAEMSQAWQVYRAGLAGGIPKPLTSQPGGAMAASWLPNGRFVYSSPVPRSATAAHPAPAVPALFTQSITGGPPARLTHGLVAATDPTVLADGRILFVSGVPTAEGSAPAATSLFTINNDGTEITPYAGQHDGPTATRRPRETRDGRILFLSSGAGGPALQGRIEQVLAARPYRSRSVAFPQIAAPCRAVEPTDDGNFLATLRETGPDRVLATFAVYRLSAGTVRLGTPVFDDPTRNEVEAISATRPVRPLGRLSNVDPTRTDATLLCLDAHLSDRPVQGPNNPTNRGTHLRVVAYGGPTPNVPRILGEVRLQSDGSAMAMVPADLPLAIELLDADRNILRRCPPAFWLRPGENRSCVGCHEPHNRAPENNRPLAVREPPVKLLPARSDLTQSP